MDNASTSAIGVMLFILCLVAVGVFFVGQVRKDEPQEKGEFVDNAEFNKREKLRRIHKENKQIIDFFNRKYFLDQAFFDENDKKFLMKHPKSIITFICDFTYNFLEFSLADQNLNIANKWQFVLLTNESKSNFATRVITEIETDLVKIPDFDKFYKTQLSNMRSTK